jgi:hypothetical protein
MVIFSLGTKPQNADGRTLHVAILKRTPLHKAVTDLDHQASQRNARRSRAGRKAC